MTKLYISIFSVFLLSNPILVLSAPPVTEINSVPRAVLEIMAKNYQPQTDDKIETPSIPYTHESEKNNSLYRATLAIQGVTVNLRLNSASDVSYSRYTNTSEKNNSLYRGAMEK